MTGKRKTDRADGRPVGTPKTQRLRRLECEQCGYLAYVSRRWIATGLPVCPCGGVLMPEDPEDARLILTDEQMDDHPTVAAWQRELARVTRGQAGIAHRYGQTGKRGAMKPATDVAMARLERAQRERIAERRLSGLMRGSFDPSRDSIDPMPF